MLLQLSPRFSHIHSAHVLSSLPLFCPTLAPSRLLLILVLCGSIAISQQSTISPNLETSKKQEINLFSLVDPGQPIATKFYQFQPGYSENSEILTYRLHVFEINKGIINRHNRDATKTYRMGLNSFAAMSQQEFYKINTNVRILQNAPSIRVQKIAHQVGNPPEVQKKIQYPYSPVVASTNLSQFTMNWTCYASKQFRKYGQCQSTYVITALQATRILLASTKYSYVNLSIQEVLSCLSGDNIISKGCEGGHYLDVYQYLKTKGVGLEQLYPYSKQSRDQGQTPECKKELISEARYKKNKVYIKDYKVVPFGDCTQLLHRLQQCPVSVGIGGWQFQYYSSGTYSVLAGLAKWYPEWGLTLVGFDATRGYYVRSSFGGEWGIGGYAYVDESAGICNWAIHPILDNATDVKPSSC